MCFIIIHSIKSFTHSDPEVHHRYQTKVQCFRAIKRDKAALCPVWITPLSAWLMSLSWFIKTRFYLYQCLSVSQSLSFCMSHSHKCQNEDEELISCLALTRNSLTCIWALQALSWQWKTNGKSCTCDRPDYGCKNISDNWANNGPLF